MQICDSDPVMINIKFIKKYIELWKMLYLNNQTIIMKKIFTTTLLICCFTICLAAINDLSGKWSGQLVSEDGTEYPLLYNLALAGDSIIGTAKSPQGTFPIENGAVDSSGFSFKVTVNGLDIPHTGKFYGDSIGMDISLNGSSVHCRLNREE